MYIPQTPYTQIAFDTIRHYFHHGHVKNLQSKNIPEEILHSERGCFVSLHKKNDDLRGCIGTIEPREKNLAEEIRRNAISAAFHDSRFLPLEEYELDEIKISVDVLTIPEEIFSYDDLDPQIYGLIISDGKYQKGVLLPALPGIDTVEQQIKIVKRKAGLSKIKDQELSFYRFTSNRYH